MVLVTNIEDKVYWYIVQFCQEDSLLSYDEFQKQFIDNYFGHVKYRYLNIENINLDLDKFLLDGTEKLFEIMKNKLYEIDIDTDDKYIDGMEYNEDIVKKYPINLFDREYLEIIDLFHKTFCDECRCECGDEENYISINYFVISYLTKCVKIHVENCNMTKSANKLE